MNTQARKSLANSLLDKHGLGWSDDKTCDKVWTVAIVDLLKLAGVWTKKASYRLADLRKLAVLPEGEIYAAAGLCVFKHKVIFIDRQVRARDLRANGSPRDCPCFGRQTGAWKRMAEGSSADWL